MSILHSNDVTFEIDGTSSSVNAKDFMADKPTDVNILGQYEDVTKYVTNPLTISPSIRAAFLKLADVMQNQTSLLDIGCYGGYAFDLVRQGSSEQLSYTGVDINQEVIEAAKELHHDSSATFVCADLFDLGDEYAADVVFCSRVLIHMTNIKAGLMKLWELTNRHLICTLNFNGDKCERYKVTNKTTGAESYYYLHCISEKQGLAMLQTLPNVKSMNISNKGKNTIIHLEKNK